MSNTSYLILKNELTLLLRERTLYVLVTIFFVMAVLSTGIGWATAHTIQSVYDSAVAELASVGSGAPPFPVNSTPLSIMTNMIIYVVLIGSLLAIVLGYFVGIHDRVYGVTKLLYARPITSRQLFFGKLATLVFVLFGILSVAYIVSNISLAVFGVFSLSAVGSVTLFYLMSFVYLLGFGCIAFAFACYFKKATRALLYGLFLWLMITFALPELGSALYPTSSLNPVLPPSTVIDSPSLALAHTLSYPFSVAEHYKSLSGILLNITSSGDSVGSTPYHTVVVLMWSLLALALAYWSFTAIDPTNETSYD